MHDWHIYMQIKMNKISRVLYFVCTMYICVNLHDIESNMWRPAVRIDIHPSNHFNQRSILNCNAWFIAFTWVQSNEWLNENLIEDEKKKQYSQLHIALWMTFTIMYNFTVCSRSYTYGHNENYKNIKNSSNNFANMHPLLHVLNSK